MNLTIKRDDVLLAGLNASDDEKGALSYNVVTEPEHGTLKLNSNGNFSYIPTEDYMGNDSFTYKANNGFSDSNIANVTIKITPPTPPIANDMNLTMKQSKSLNNTFNITNPYKTTLTFSIIKTTNTWNSKNRPRKLYLYPYKNLCWHRQLHISGKQWIRLQHRKNNHKHQKMETIPLKEPLSFFPIFFMRSQISFCLFHKHFHHV